MLTQLSGCSSMGTHSGRDGAPSRDVDVSHVHDAVPKVEARSKYGNPKYYYVHGKKQYVLNNAKGYNKVGFASWYGTKFHGQLTSSREPYDMYGMTAASRDLPIPTYVRVTNLENGKSIIVKVNDRGPFVGNRLIDLSYVAAKKLGYANHGTTLVRVTAIDPVEWASAQKGATTKLAMADNSNIRYQQTKQSNQYFLQVGAFSNRHNAEALRSRIAKITQAPVAIKPSYDHSTPLYRVQIGPLLASDSVNLRQTLENNGITQSISVVS